MLLRHPNSMSENQAENTRPTLEQADMAHYPVNHPLRPLYRALAAVVGVALILFGVIGFIQTSGDGLFGHPEAKIVGLGGNLAASILSVLLGLVVVAATVIGRNVDTATHRVLGWTILVIGSYELAVSRTDANFLDFSIGTVTLYYTLGVLLILSGLYTKTETEDSHVSAPRQVREGRTA